MNRTHQRTASFSAILACALGIAWLVGAGGAKAGSQSEPSAAATPVPVAIKDFKFDPAAVTITTGQSIVWKNYDSAAHTATADGQFDSGNLDQGQSYKYTFNKAGRFEYVCTYHPYMKAVVTVVAPSSSSSAGP